MRTPLHEAEFAGHTVQVPFTGLYPALQLVA